ncbi:MAG: SPOR domain-containing protein [Chitinophagaceae bacterium]|nr:SPOR domain-containing protein [Chitinophagaceae bacterium]
MKPLFAIILIFSLTHATAQNSLDKPLDSGTVIVHKDPRLDVLIKKQIQINEETTREARKNIKGYRLLVINTNNREEALAAKTKVYTYFPELRPYLIWQSPFFKLKVGNFRDRKDADEYRKKMAAYFPKGVFIINDIIEVKLEDPESDN